MNQFKDFSFQRQRPKPFSHSCRSQELWRCRSCWNHLELANLQSRTCQNILIWLGLCKDPYRKRKL